MTNNRKIFFVLFIFVLLAVFTIINISVIKEYCMKFLFFHNIGKIVNKHSRIFHSSKFLDNKRIDWLIEMTNYNQKNLSALNSDEKILYISLKSKVMREPEPIELYAMFDVFQFLMSPNAYNTVAITYELQYGGWELTITKKDFEKLYEMADTNEKSTSEISQILSQMWIYDNFYNRLGLFITQENDYLNQLITYWNHNVDFGMTSNDGKYKMSYDEDSTKLYPDDTVSVWEIVQPDFEKPGYIVTPGHSSLSIIPIKETGFACATWDEYNNIWVYGEDSGLTFIKYDGNKVWEIADMEDEQIPYPIQKVMEKKGIAK